MAVAQEARKRVSVRLAPELVAASREAVTLGLAATPSEFIEEAVRRRAREVHEARLRKLVEEAMTDPDFVADMRDTMQAFQYTGTDGRAVSEQAE